MKEFLMCYVGIKRTLIHYFYFMRTQKEILGYYKYKFHDIDKIIMYLFIPFIGKKRIAKIHQKYNKHHIREYKSIDKIDILEAIIDWESSKYKKYSYNQNAIEYFKEHKSNSKYSKEILGVFNSLKYYENYR